MRLQSGEEIRFDKLVVATGAKAKTLDVPGSDLSGIYYLRTLEDSKRIRQKAESAKQAVVIGGGFIAMEVSSVLAQKGIGTTMVLHEDRIWKRFFTAEMSRFFDAYYTARGVKFEPLIGSGVDVTDGVVVNEYLETSRPDIYAAGDVANYYDVLFGKHRRAEDWDNAVSQGQHYARVLSGERMPFVHVPYFFSDVFDLSYEFWGDPSGAEEIVERGDLSSSSFSVWWLRQGRLAAAFTMNRPNEEREAAPRLIQSREAVSARTLPGAR